LIGHVGIIKNTDEYNHNALHTNNTEGTNKKIFVIGNFPPWDELVNITPIMLKTK
jgi:hypothetical protein